MIHNSEVADILDLVGIPLRAVPARSPKTADEHVRLLSRYVGYRSGISSARDWRDGYELSKGVPGILGDCLWSHVFKHGFSASDIRAYPEMLRLAALISGATGYPMTDDAVLSNMRRYFWKAVLDDIKDATSFNAGHQYQNPMSLAT